VGVLRDCFSHPGGIIPEKNIYPRGEIFLDSPLLNGVFKIR